MSNNEREHIQEHIRVYLNVFGALAILTVVTVAVSYLEVTIVEGIMLALYCLCKSQFGCWIFHASNFRKQTIIWILILTFVFFLVLMFVPLLTVTDNTGLY